MEEFGHDIQGNNPGSLLRGIGNFLLESSRAFEEHPGNSSRSCQQSHTVETDDEQEDVLKRANAIQRVLKTRVQPKNTNKGDLTISVCAMTETSSGEFKRGKAPYVELAIKKSEKYASLATKAAKKCGVVAKNGQTLCLFNMNGAQIMDEELGVVPWTLGCYLRKCRRAAEKLKIGIGCITQEKDTSVLYSANQRLPSKEKKSSISPSAENAFGLNVKYYFPSQARAVSVKSSMTRLQIWSVILEQDANDIGCYFPEDDGYEIYTIYKNKNPLLTPVLDEECCVRGHEVTGSSDDFNIVHQSSTPIVVQSMTKPILLYTISSYHGGCTYSWRKVGGNQIFPSTPVIYVDEPGMYQCLVKTTHDCVLSDLFRVLVNPDTEPSITSLPPPFKKCRVNVQLGSPNTSSGLANTIKHTEKIKSLWDVTAQKAHDVQGVVERYKDQYKGNSPIHISQEDHHLDQHPDHRSNYHPDHRSGHHPDHHSGHCPDHHDNPDHHSNHHPDHRSGHRPDHHSGHCPDHRSNHHPDYRSGHRKQTEPESSQQNNIEERLDEAIPKRKNDNFAIQAREFSENDIAIATNNFSDSNKIGKGGFGIVYLGYMKGTKVAVKRFTEHARQRGMDIPDQFTIDGQLNCAAWALSRCRQRNLVELVGFCKSPPMLLYEYMENGSLYIRLFKKKPPLTWPQRSRILKDVCRGLSWIHSCTPPLMHGDVKLHNILLDENHRAKLGDFGFCRELPQMIGGRSVVSVALVARSAGYAAPESEGGHISPKSDMFSYGVCALEMFTGKVAYDKSRDDPKLIDHFDEQQGSTEGYKSIVDTTAGDLEPYLLHIYNKLIENCLLKHSKRCTSEKVMEWWSETKF